MRQNSVREAVEGGLWIAGGSYVTSLLGLVFWLLVARLAGAEAVGRASAILSASMLPSSILASGFYAASIREAAIGGTGSVLLTALVLGSAAAAASIPLAAGLGIPSGILWAPILALLGVLGSAAGTVMIGSGRFTRFFAAATTASIVKLSAAAILLLVGYGFQAALLGLAAYSLTIVLFLAGVPVTRPSRTSIVRLAGLAASNYPYTLASQLPITLTIYAYAYAEGAGAGTGTLYVSFMALAALASLPGSIYAAGIRIAARGYGDPFTEAARLGTAAVAPLAAILVASPKDVLRIIGRGLAENPMPLAILASILPLQAYLAAAIARMNGLDLRKGLASVGAVRLASLFTLLPILVGSYGSTGAALAYTASAIAAAPLALKNLPSSSNTLAMLQLVMLTPYTYTFLPLPGYLKAAAAAATTTLLVLGLKLLKPYEVAEGVRIVLNMIRRSKAGDVKPA